MLHFGGLADLPNTALLWFTDSFHVSVCSMDHTVVYTIPLCHKLFALSMRFVSVRETLYVSFPHTLSTYLMGITHTHCKVSVPLPCTTRPVNAINGCTSCRYRPFWPSSFPFPTTTSSPTSMLEEISFPTLSGMMTSLMNGCDTRCGVAYGTELVLNSSYYGSN